MTDKKIEIEEVICLAKHGNKEVLSILNNTLEGLHLKTNDGNEEAEIFKRYLESALEYIKYLNSKENEK